MNKLSIQMLVGAVLISSAVFAGQENKGGGHPVPSVACTTENDGLVQVTKTSSDQVMVRVTVDAGKASEQSKTYSATQVAQNPHQMGAPLEFKGPGIDLSIGVDTAPTPQGIHSTVNAPELGLHFEPAFCKLGV